MGKKSLESGSGLLTSTTGGNYLEGSGLGGDIGGDRGPCTGTFCMILPFLGSKQSTPTVPGSTQAGSALYVHGKNEENHWG